MIGGRSSGLRVSGPRRRLKAAFQASLKAAQHLAAFCESVFEILERRLGQITFPEGDEEMVCRFPKLAQASVDGLDIHVQMTVLPSFRQVRREGIGAAAELRAQLVHFVSGEAHRQPMNFEMQLDQPLVDTKILEAPNFLLSAADSHQLSSCRELLPPTTYLLRPSFTRPPREGCARHGSRPGGWRETRSRDRASR